MIDDAKLERFLARVRREVDEGLSPAVQVAIGHQGRVVVDETFGAPPESRFLVFSATKAFVGSAFWRLLDRGDVALTDRVADHLPEFATNGKDAVTVEHVLTHTGGFPSAPIGPATWTTREQRGEAYARWRLTTDPGSTFFYHPTSGHWVLADILRTITGLDHTDAVQQLVTDPLGLPRVLGIPLDQQDGIVESVAVGELPTADEVEAAFGFRIDLATIIPPEVGVQALLTLNDPDARVVGNPGGGGVMRAADLALLYQGFLHDPAGLWSAEALEQGTRNPRLQLPDWAGTPANRTLGLVMAGDDGQAAYRGFGRTASPRSFGHAGAGGQIAFADPDSGLSIAYATAGMDQHIIREKRRTTAIASLAADLLVGDD